MKLSRDSWSVTLPWEIPDFASRSLRSCRTTVWQSRLRAKKVASPALHLVQTSCYMFRAVPGDGPWKQWWNSAGSHRFKRTCWNFVSPATYLPYFAKCISAWHSLLHYMRILPAKSSVRRNPNKSTHMSTCNAHGPLCSHEHMQYSRSTVLIWAHAILTITERVETEHVGSTTQALFNRKWLRWSSCKYAMFCGINFTHSLFLVFIFFQLCVLHLIMKCWWWNAPHDDVLMMSWISWWCVHDEMHLMMMCSWWKWAYFI